MARTVDHWNGCHSTHLDCANDEIERLCEEVFSLRNNLDAITSSLDLRTLVSWLPPDSPCRSEYYTLKIASRGD